jgi:hypothetical protein
MDKLRIQVLDVLGAREQSVLEWEASALVIIEALLATMPLQGNRLAKTNRLVALAWQAYKAKGGYRG